MQEQEIMRMAQAMAAAMAMFSELAKSQPKANVAVKQEKQKTAAAAEESTADKQAEFVKLASFRTGKTTEVIIEKIGDSSVLFTKIARTKEGIKTSRVGFRLNEQAIEALKKIVNGEPTVQPVQPTRKRGRGA
jgi:hypothetical protein